IFKNQVVNLQMATDTPEKQAFYNSLVLEELLPILNRDLQRDLNIPFDLKKTKNRYTKYLKKIEDFTKEYLFTESFKQICDFRSQEFIDAPLNRIGHIDKEKGLLEYGKDPQGNKQTGITPKLELNKIGRAHV